MNDNNEQLNNEVCSLSDLGLITFLSLTLPILYIDRSDLKRVYFIFSKNAEIDKIIASYMDDSARVSPQKYQNQVRIIKNLIYENT